MSWTAEDEALLVALKQQAMKGVRTVTYRDKSVTYNSIDDLLKAIAQAEAEKAAELAGPYESNGRVTLAVTSRE